MGMLADVVGGEARLRVRIVDLAARVDRDKLDARTRVASETAERYVAGELPPPDDV
jgi:hypothetical protein